MVLEPRTVAAHTGQLATGAITERVPVCAGVRCALVVLEVACEAIAIIVAKAFVRVHKTADGEVLEPFPDDAHQDIPAAPDRHRVQVFTGPGESVDLGEVLIEEEQTWLIAQVLPANEQTFLIRRELERDEG